jgi:hypothetical protein
LRNRHKSKKSFDSSISLNLLNFIFK